MFFTRAALKRGIEKAFAFTHIAVTVESVREFRTVFSRKLMQKKIDQEDLKKVGKAKITRVIEPQFVPDAETDIPKPLEEFKCEIAAYYDEEN